MSKIAIIGASSGIGLMSVKIGLARGHHIRAFSRSVDSINLEHPKLEKISGDALVAADVEKVIADCDVVIQSLGVPFNVELFTGPITLFSESTKHIIAAMKSLKKKRLIAVTGFGAGDSRASIHPLQRVGFNLVFGRAYGDKDKQEQLIKESSLDWTIARPGVLSNCAKSKNYKVLTKSQDWRNGMISRYNVADFLVKQAESDSLVRESPVLVS